jgi:S1-C subfamily serine protease
MTARLTRPFLCCIVGLLIACPTRRAAAQMVPAPLLADLKAATVFVKVQRRTLDWSGSGFVIQKLKGSVLIVTNAHVLKPPKIDDADIAKGIPSTTMKLLFELQNAASGVESLVSVVFFSGTPQEQVLPAEIIGQDSKHDLAVLKVAGAPDSVKAIRLNTQKLPETTSLLALGFPFGGMMSQAKTNPTITVSRAELTSYKPISDDLTLLQLQGVLNPGCSGGPVVDMQGKLCGVQVAVIRGSGLGFAIPTDEVMRMARGNLTNWRMAAKMNASGAFDVEYWVQLIDPMRKITDLELHYLPGAVPLVTLAEFKASPAPLAGAKPIDLKRDGQWATGTFQVPPSGLGPLVVTVQPSWIDGAKKKQLARPEVARISVNAEASAAADDGRTFWRYVDNKKGEGWFVKTPAGWDEVDDGATHHFAEVARNSDVVELYDAKRSLRVHLHHHTLAFKLGNKPWGILYKGAWEASGTVVAPK